MNIARPLAIALTVLLGAASALSAADTKPTSTTPTGFPLKIFKEVAKGHSSRNILVSPYSISTALTMTYMGSAGGTKTAMGDVLNLSGSVQQIGTRCKEVQDSLRNPGGGTKLEIANALFANADVKFNDDFLKLNKQYFNSRVSALDFKAASTPNTINSFVSESTHGKIGKIIDLVPPDSILFLINAIYFKGTWEHEFEKSKTKPRTFYFADGKTKELPMMNMTRNDFQYFETSDFQAINLGYADKRLSMYVFLPKDSTTLEAFEAQLNDQTWNDWRSRFNSRRGDLTLPKFVISDTIKLIPPLSALGMKVAFSGAADFSGMSSSAHPSISDVIHKTFMEVNEEGTEAAAVTAVTAMKTMAMAGHRVEPFRMIVDHPYFIALHDDKTDTLLFVGHIADPSKKTSD